MVAGNFILVVTTSQETIAFHKRPTKLRLDKQVEHKFESMPESSGRPHENSHARTFRFLPSGFLKPCLCPDLLNQNFW